MKFKTKCVFILPLRQSVADLISLVFLHLITNSISAKHQLCSYSLCNVIQVPVIPVTLTDIVAILRIISFHIQLCTVYLFEPANFASPPPGPTDYR
jgi:hypothetical protein